jgi:hypothetical protein
MRIRARDGQSNQPVSTASERRAFLAHYRLIAVTRQYYHIGISVSPVADAAEWYVQAEWAGWEDAKQRIDRRSARPVDPYWITETWQQSGLPYVVVNDPAGLAVFLALGGHALVETALAEEFLPDIIERRGEVADELRCAPPAPIPNSPRVLAAMRDAALRRDGHTCRLCPRKSARGRPQAVRVRAIRPIATGGRQEPANLITVCARCEAMLAPALETHGHAGEVATNGGSPSQLDTFQYQAWLAAAPIGGQ